MKKYMDCPCGIHDDYLENKAHAGEDVRICSIRGQVVWVELDCCHCFRGKVVRLVQKIGCIVDTIKFYFYRKG